MQGPLRRIIVGCLTFLLICVFAAFGYIAAGWDAMDAVYMVIITIFGVGYGEVQPVTSVPLRVLTIFVIIGGYASVIYTVGGIMQMVVDGEINKAMGARRMTIGIDRMRGHVVVCGFGQFGSMLARELSALGKTFVVIDQSTEVVDEAERMGFHAIVGNAAEEEVLLRAGIKRAKALAAATSDDAANLFVTLTARELNDEMAIIARGQEPATEKKLLRCGATRVVLPAATGAQRMAHLIARPTAEDLLDESTSGGGLHEELHAMGLQLDELQIDSGSLLTGRTLADIQVHGNRGFLIVALRKACGETVVNPPGEALLEAGDTVIVLGHEDDIPQLVNRYALKREMTYRGVKA